MCNELEHDESIRVTTAYALHVSSGPSGADRGSSGRWAWPMSTLPLGCIVAHNIYAFMLTFNLTMEEVYHLKHKDFFLST